MFRLLFFILVVCVSCTSNQKKTGVINSECGKKTDVHVNDMGGWGFTDHKNKVVVLRLFATWCPYCKEDFTELGRQFKAKRLTPENTQILLLAYHNRRETKSTFNAFMKETFPKFGIPASAVQAIYIDEDFRSLSAHQTSAGQRIFEGWQGVPFTLVFAKDGRLAFRGHFTTSPPLQDSHYEFVHRLTSESCSIVE